MNKVNYTFRTKDHRSYIEIKADYSDLGEARARSIAKAELSKMGDDIEGLRLYCISQSNA